MSGEPEEAMLFPTTVGDRLRAARIAKGLELADVAARTRIPLRHLEAIETANYAGLPSITYAMGFAKSYARAVEVDEVAIAKDLRAELSHVSYERAPPTPVYVTGEPSRLPPSGLAVVGGLLALLVLIGVGVWYGTGLFRGEAPANDTTALIEPAPAPAPAPAEPAAAATPAPPTGGQVTLTATDTVWVRVYDATGQRLYEKEMMPGDRYDVPQDANNPMINVGRPDKLAITVNGTAIPPLGTGERPIKDIGVSAQALLARVTPAGAAGAAPAPSPLTDLDTPLNASANP